MKKTRNEFASQNDVRFDDPSQRFAHLADLRARPTSEAAKDAVKAISSEITRHLYQAGQIKNLKAGNKLAEYEFAVSSFLYEVIKGAANAPAKGWVSIEFSAASATDEMVSYRQRVKIRDGLEALEFIEVSKGKQFVTRSGFGGKALTVQQGRTTRLRATQTLLNVLESIGITPKTYFEHFFVELPQWTIKLRAQSKGYGKSKAKGKILPVPRNDRTEALDADLQTINHFTLAQNIEGTAFHGYIRLFNNGDAEDFNWNKGGRLYAHFQRLKSEDRRKIKINGEPIVEIDVSASFLTILHGLLDLPFDRESDAYTIDGVQREAVKAFISQTFGLGALPKRWSRSWDHKFQEAYGYSLAQKYKLAEVKEVILAKYPSLMSLEERNLSWADLMFIESEAMLNAMLVLKSQYQVPSLLVHDSLIVPQSYERQASATIRSAYFGYCKIDPRLKVKQDIESDFKDLGLDTEAGWSI
jgi:hypothetical protein